MFEKAVLEGIKKELALFNRRLLAFGCKPLGFLGGRRLEPRIASVTHASKVANGTMMTFGVYFPGDPGDLTDRRFGEIGFLIGEGGRPPDGFLFEAKVDKDTRYKGVVGYVGEHWHIDWTRLPPAESP